MAIIHKMKYNKKQPIRISVSGLLRNVKVGAFPSKLYNQIIGPNGPCETKDDVVKVLQSALDSGVEYL